ncbi:hypothetical protein TIFTF001_020868 [Ficus carica]|uniref:F-box domain-containing protein n=1 Tax=Ficus carica TaxID=3494 RepID=A0AA88ABL4_FICCA|nr:hypothetical protein TIFTF001_020868 [Ficus carica]
MAENLDFIRKLPDSLLLEIISLLSYKEATRTSILSKRWRHILPTSATIVLNERNGTIPTHFFAEFKRTRLTKTNQESHIDMLSLTLTKPQDFVNDITNCIAFSKEGNAKVILLDFSSPTWGENDVVDDYVGFEAKFDLPFCVYGLKSLETLKLFSCNFDASMLKSFVSLKHLSLGWIELSASSVKDLVENCVSLESLSMKRCWNIGFIEIKGQGLRLESLNIDKCNIVRGWINIEAPNIRLFKYSGEFCTFEFNSTQRIEEVVLDFGIQSELGEVGPLLFETFREFYAAKILTVCSFVLQAIVSREEPLGLKPRLAVKHLILKTALHENELYGVRFFLNSCPLLETLTIDINPAKRIFEEYEPPFSEPWTKALPLYKCLVKSLKVVEVKGFKGSQNQVSLLIYFITYGRVLKKLDINVSKEVVLGESPEIYIQKAQILQTLNKASPSLQISIF